MIGKEIKVIMSNVVPKNNYTRLEQTINVLKTNNKSAKRNNLAETGLRLTKYIGWKVWLIQGLYLIITSQLMYGLSVFSNNLEQIIGMKILFVICGGIPYLSLPYLYRSWQYNMNEIEGASYYSYSSQLIIKMLTIGIGDICMLAGGVLLSISIFHISALKAIVICTLPFLLLSSVLLFVISHIKANKSFFVCGGVYISFLIINEMITSYFPIAYDKLTSIYVYGACFLLLMIIMFQIKGMIQEKYIIGQEII